MNRRHFLHLASAATALPGLAAEEASGQPAARPSHANTVQTQPSLLSNSARKSAFDQLTKYFAGTAPQLLRPPQGILKYPSIAPSLPGKTYSTSLWDWDTLWTTRGLFAYAKLAGDRALHDQICEHAIGSLNNFLDHQSEEGRIPIMVDVHRADLFGSVEKDAPAYRNQAKPVFGQLALLTADQIGSPERLAPFLDKLLAFYSTWTKTNLSQPGLLVWGDDVAIGNDNDPTTFGRPFFSSANLLLNCLFYQDLKATAQLAARVSRIGDSHQLDAQAEQLAAKIRELCWDPRDRYFYTADVQCVDRRAELIPTVKPGMAMSWSTVPLRIQTFTGFLPLWAGIATHDQAAQLIHANYLADDRLRAAWGVRSLSSRETMYSLVFSSNPSNWLGPVWIIVNYLTWRALGNYGFADLQSELRDKTLRLLAKDLAANGSLNEYYHPDTGAALSHKGFMDWNLLVMDMAG
ncbi:MAG TPA: trehalase family glycosidase [Acidobacteriaceae bacterium]|nr:trehalase family glycosidase [Acidobacteriaceae bacterium]